MARNARYRWRGWRTTPHEPPLKRFGGHSDRPVMQGRKKKRRPKAAWIQLELRYAGTCSRCKAELEVGTVASWHPKSKKVFCKSCATALQLPTKNNLATTAS